MVLPTMCNRHYLLQDARQQHFVTVSEGKKMPTPGGWLRSLVGPHGLEPWTKGFYRFQLSLLKF